MQPFTTVTGPAAPLLRRDIDTDVIIRIERLTQLPRGELGRHALEALRGPGFVLDRAPFRRAPILLAGANFGCGSSREGAVWALQEAGLRAIIAPSFGDIFFSNCFQSGMLPVVLPEATVTSLAEQAADGASVTVDLPHCRVIAPDGTPHCFTIDPLRREMLLEGVDELGLTLRRIAEIAAWQRADAVRRPWCAPNTRELAP
jgi:3-isopropylmalate/(R)-2-methylmalate dehydratase small subunit